MLHTFLHDVTYMPSWYSGIINLFLIFLIYIYIYIYIYTPHGEGLVSLCRFLETRDNKQISSDTLMELAEVVLKNNIFEFDENTFKQKRGTAVGTKFAPPYTILFMADFEEKMLKSFEKKHWF